MPNWCSNKLTINTATPEQKGELKQWYDFVSSPNYYTSTKTGLFYHLLPTPSNMSDEIAIKTKVDLWGTKWDIASFGNIDYNVDEVNGDLLILDFDTAWSPPLGVCMELVKRGYYFRLEYFEPGSDFGGVVENYSDIAEPTFSHSNNISNPNDEIRQEIEDTFCISDWYFVEEEEEEE